MAITTCSTRNQMAVAAAVLLIVYLASRHVFPSITNGNPAPLETRKEESLSSADHMYWHSRLGAWQSECLIVNNTNLSVNNGTPTTTPQPNSLERLVADAGQIFVNMPPKGSGTFLKYFVRKCMKEYFLTHYNETYTSDYWLTADLKSLLTQDLHLPPIVASHCGRGEYLIKLMKQTTSDTLIVYSHREENSRVVSAVQHILRARICNLYPAGGLDLEQLIVTHSSQSGCYVDETALVEVIQRQILELTGQDAVLTCQLYHALEEYAPNMVFVNYSQASQLQQVLAQKYCPSLAGKMDLVMNFFPDDKIFIQLANNDDNHQDNGNHSAAVSMKQWIEAKRHLLEWSLNMREKAQCRGQTKHMERDLDACPSQAILAIPP